MQSVFTFEYFKYNEAHKKFEFYYSLLYKNRKTQFVEEIELPTTLSLNSSDSALNMILKSLHIACGISYWKIFCPEKIKLASYTLSEFEANFWNIIYTKGLGEFYYKNQIDFRKFAGFPYSREIKVSAQRLKRRSRCLVGIGGGKDSIVTATLLQNAKVDFDGFVVQTHKSYILIDNVIDALKIKSIKINRKLDPKIFDFNEKPSAYKGHIPISTIYAFLGVLTAYLYNYKYVIVSNERSSEQGNIDYLGMNINHQWSKSYEFETVFSNYISHAITSDIKYFSMLRPLSELQIASKFSKYKKFHSIFSSCNRNFTMDGGTKLRWCCNCPKCIFVFILLASVCDKAYVINIFNKNIFLDKNIIPLLLNLVGYSGIKPFDCVGTLDETMTALSIIQKTKAFENTIVMKELVKKRIFDNLALKNKSLFSCTLKNNDQIPKKFQNIINKNFHCL